MNRRRVIASTGAALSSMTGGCLGGLLGRQPTGRRVSLAEVGAVGEDHPVRLEVTLARRTMGPDVAPEVEVSLASTADEALFLGYAESWPADGLLPDRDSDPPGIRLLAASEVSDVTVESQPCPHTAFRPVTEAARGGHRVAPSATIPVSYRVLGSDQAAEGGCPGSGRYRWWSAYGYARASAVERVGFEDAERRQFGWGFTIEVPADA